METAERSKGLAFDPFFREWFPKLVSLGTTMTGRHDVAVEVAQEALLRAHRRWDAIGGYDAPGAWDRGYIAFANAVAGRLGSPAALRTIQVVKSDAEGGRVVVTTEHDLDDSAYGTELRMLIGFDRSVDVFGWVSACQPGRGHQDYRAASCT